MKKNISYFACDRKCNKAWGMNSRPKVEFDKEDPDDYAFLSDDELGEAPKNPGTYEGGHAKPNDRSQIPNKWCLRECERCVISKTNESHLPDYSKRNYNQPWKH